MSDTTAHPIVMPALGDMETGTIAEWTKASGDLVARGEIVAVVDADKASLELEAPAAGILDIEAEREAEVAVGEVIGWVRPQ